MKQAPDINVKKAVLLLCYLKKDPIPTDKRVNSSNKVSKILKLKISLVRRILDEFKTFHDPELTPE